MGKRVRLAAALGVLLSFAAVEAAAMADFGEDGRTVACGYNKTSARPAPGKRFGEAGSVQDLPVPIYARAGDRMPQVVVRKFISLLAVEKKGRWLKVVGTYGSAPYFKANAFAGYVKENDLQWGALRNCS
jgi:hypothetical protein